MNVRAKAFTEALSRHYSSGSDFGGRLPVFRRGWSTRTGGSGARVVRPGRLLVLGHVD